MPSDAPKIFGKHILADMYVTNRDFLINKDRLGSMLVDAAWAAGATVLDSVFHQFPITNGVSGILLLAESHISVHTWPENDFIAFDIFTCGDCDCLAALNHIEKAVGALTDRTDIRAFNRGDLWHSITL